MIVKPNRWMIPGKRAGIPGAGRKGFTLIELVTAAAIFSLLGVMLLTMVRSGMSMWKKGELSRNEADRGVQVLELISRELRLAFTANDPLAGEPEARFICDFFACDRDGDGVEEFMTQRLRFVRINVEERENALQRLAGDRPSGYRNFTLNETPLLDEALPTGGLAEAVFMSYAPRLAKGETRDGLLCLYRGYRTPPGGVDSYFGPSRLRTTTDLERGLVQVLDGILHLEFRFWDPETISFDAEMVDPELSGGAGFTWDSTRALLTDEPGDWPNVFRFAESPDSLENGEDDLFPEQVMITVVVEDPLIRETGARTTESIDKVALSIPLDMVKPFMHAGNAEGGFVRLGDEWVSFSGIEDGALVVSKRGARHTRPDAHPAGTQVRQGRRFSTVVSLPTARKGRPDV